MSSAPPGPLLVDVAGTGLTAADRELLAHPSVGGVILFARNCADAGQVAELTRQIRQLRSPRLLIAMDQEGGRIQRLRSPLTRLPPAAAYAASCPDDMPAAGDLAHQAGWLMAAELLAVGVDLSFAPVLDIDRALGEVIGDRAFASTPQAVSLLAGAFAAGMNEAGMAACGKHFPGHGAVSGDSHQMLPEDTRPMVEIEQDLQPFRALIDRGLQSVMLAHIRYTETDNRPASLSPHWITTVLRRQLRFTGIVFCDDLSMNGAASAGDYRQRVRQALLAGCDMLPVCNNREAVEKLLDHVTLNPASATRIARLQVNAGSPTLAQLQRTARWQLIRDRLTDMAC